MERRTYSEVKMGGTISFCEALGASRDLEQEYGRWGVGSLYWSIRNFAMAYAMAKKAGLSVTKVPIQFDNLKFDLEEWPSYLQPAAGAIEEIEQFVRDMIMSVAGDEAEEERLNAGLNKAIREDFKAAIAEAEQSIAEAAAA